MPAKKPKKSNRVAKPQAKATQSEPPDELSETERERIDEQFDELEEEMWDFLEKTQADGRKMLQKMVALRQKYPEEIDDARVHMQQPATAIKQLVEGIPDRPVSVSILLSLAED